MVYESTITYEHPVEPTPTPPTTTTTQPETKTWANTMTIPWGSIPSVYQQQPIQATPVKEYTETKVEGFNLFGLPLIYGVKKITYTPQEYAIKQEWEQQQTELGPINAKIKQLSFGYLELFDPNMWIAASQGKEEQYMQARDIAFTKNIQEGKILEAWAGLQAPAYENVIIPLATGRIFKYIGLGEMAAKVGGYAEKAYKYFVNPTQKIIQYGVVPATIGTDIGLTAAKTGGFTSKEVLGKIGTLGWQFGLMGVGYKYSQFETKLQNQQIITKTIGIRNPENPTEALFISKVKGKDIYSIVETKPLDVGLEKPISVSTGTMYYKTPKEISFKEQPIFGATEGKYMGELKDFMATKSTGIAIGKDETIFSKGASLAKTLYEGEMLPKGTDKFGILKQRKSTVELIESVGAFKGKTTKGIFGDIAKIITPKVKGKEYYGSDMGFAQSGLDLITVTKDITSILPGGIFAETAKLEPPHLFPMMYPRNAKTIVEDEIAYASSHWIGIKPAISERVSIVSPITNLKKDISLAIQDMGIKSRTEIKQDVLQTNITRQILNSIQLPEVIQGLKQQPIQITEQKQDAISIQLQQSLQQQLQIQESLQLQELVQQQIQLQQLVTIPGIINLTREVPIQQQQGNSFDVLVKNRQYEHGKKVYPTSFSRVTKEPLTQQDAMAFGADVVGHNAKATFKLEPSNKPPVRLAKVVDPWSKVGNQFDIKPDGRIIERTKFRINTPGELKEITYKGIEARINKVSRRMHKWR
jgi:hypothetical protein